MDKVLSGVVVRREAEKVKGLGEVVATVVVVVGVRKGDG